MKSETRDVHGLKQEAIVRQRRVPILITWDVDPVRQTAYDRRHEALSMAVNLCRELDIKATFFVTARCAGDYPDDLQWMRALRQEIGCHGLTHKAEEEYNRMPEAMQRAYIEEATGILEAAVGMPVRAFRSPRVKTSATTLRLLAEYGYLVDSSVCSQRLDFVSSNLINKGWLLAPRRPYHPHYIDPFKRGNLPIWEVPISAFVVPFISGALNVFGLRFMKTVFRVLYAESRRTGKPIVYLAHPLEFISSGRRRKSRSARKQLRLAYIRTHGFMMRRVLYRMDGETWLKATRELFAYMCSFPKVTPMTISEYVNCLGDHGCSV
jgi:peptidoglycan/xylan/chitin deacetylase (PgdA/CDA1 family)